MDRGGYENKFHRAVNERRRRSTPAAAMCIALGGGIHIYRIAENQMRCNTFEGRDMTTNHELEAAIHDIAKNISEVEEYPENWAPWVIYLIEELEQLATAPRRKAAFEKMLKKMAHTIASRSSLGSW